VLEISPSVRGNIATLRGFVQRFAPFLAANSLCSLRDLGHHAFLRKTRHGCTEGGAEEEEESGRGAAKAR
jgi:hypothetical protein